MTPPGAGTNGIPLRFLFGFERVHVPKGQSVTVFLYPELKDFLIVDARGKHVVHPGTYTVEFGVRETQYHGQGYARAVLHAK